jgi:predicted TIM-barrel fold metal-dependent hydrolase
MDRDGVYCQVIYGPPTGLALDDEELRTACLRSYNDWAVEFSAVSPNRLIVLALIPGHDPAVATRELLRVAKLGHKGALLYLWQSPDPVFEAVWEPFWSAAAETGVLVHFHLGGGLHSLRGQPGSWRMPAMVSVIPMQLDEVVVGIIFGGVLERHPEVKVVLGESGLGWIPYVLERMDHEHRKYRDSITDVRLGMLPSEIFRRQVYATYEEDDLGLELLARIGADNVMWASDYPHGDSTWPHSREAIGESWLSKLDADSRQKIVYDNAARLYAISSNGQWTA